MIESPPAADLILASASPRRRELLAGLGLAVQVLPADIDETRQLSEPVVEYVTRLALSKAAAVRARTLSALPVLAGDTVVALGEENFDKPRDRDDAIRMLTALGGKTHAVHTAVALDHAGAARAALVSSRVTFMPIDAAAAAAYWASGESADKAGAYGIQGLGGRFVAHLEGSYSAVMGLPVFETANLLAESGIDIVHRARMDSGPSAP
ncbi:MAG: Maf family protein [Pseudomonadota bacterium]